VLWVSNLGEENGRAHLSHRVAETQDQATSEVCLPVLADGRNDTTNDHDDTSNGDRQLTTPSVCNRWHDEEAGNGTKVVGAVLISSWVTTVELVAIAHLFMIPSLEPEGFLKNDSQ